MAGAILGQEAGHECLPAEIRAADRDVTEKWDGLGKFDKRGGVFPPSSSCCDSKHHESAAPTTEDVRVGRKFSVSPMTRLCCG